MRARRRLFLRARHAHALGCERGEHALYAEFCRAQSLASSRRVSPCLLAGDIKWLADLGDPNAQAYVVASASARRLSMKRSSLDEDDLLPGPLHELVRRRGLAANAIGGSGAGRNRARRLGAVNCLVPMRTDHEARSAERGLGVVNWAGRAGLGCTSDGHGGRHDHRAGPSRGASSRVNAAVLKHRVLLTSKVWCG